MFTEDAILFVQYVFTSVWILAHKFCMFVLCYVWVWFLCVVRPRETRPRVSGGMFNRACLPFASVCAGFHVVFFIVAVRETLLQFRFLRRLVAVVSKIIFAGWKREIIYIFKQLWMAVGLSWAWSLGLQSSLCYLKEQL